ncbi:MAG: response regulator transcription factor [Trebonia sp.]|jgi:DNA-binding NarL/FixJ family response regulator
MINIAIVDDERFVLESLVSYLSHEASDVMTVTASAVSVDALIAETAEVPHVVLLDAFLRDDTRMVDNVRRLRAWGCAVVVISRNGGSPELRRTAMDEGALSFVYKDEGLAAMRLAIESAAAGELFITPSLAKFLLMRKLDLTKRQQDVAVFIAAGLTNKEIAKQLHISDDVVKEHIKAIGEHYRKANRPVGSRDDLREKLRLDGFYGG